MADFLGQVRQLTNAGARSGAYFRDCSIWAVRRPRHAADTGDCLCRKRGQHDHAGSLETAASEAPTTSVARLGKWGVSGPGRGADGVALR
jgi:hypothetical protein